MVYTVSTSTRFEVFMVERMEMFWVFTVGDNTFLQNVNIYLQIYKAPKPKTSSVSMNDYES